MRGTQGDWCPSAGCNSGKVRRGVGQTSKAEGPNGGGDKRLSALMSILSGSRVAYNRFHPKYPGKQNRNGDKDTSFDDSRGGQGREGGVCVPAFFKARGVTAERPTSTTRQSKQNLHERREMYVTRGTTGGTTP